NGVTDAVVRFDVATGRAALAGRLPSPAADSAAVAAGNTTYLLGGESRALSSGVVSAQVESQPTPARSSAPARPFDGQLLIADRGNNRLLVVDAAKHVLWTYPSPSAPPPPG